MTSWMIVLLILVTLACAVALWRIRQYFHRQRERVRQIRESKLYAHVYPLLMRCQDARIEQVTLRREGLFIRLYHPAGRELTYVFQRHGFQPLNPNALYPMAQALAVDLKKLGDPQKYTFTPRIETLRNGEKQDYYEYNITTGYKDTVQRNLYTRKRPSA